MSLFARILTMLVVSLLILAVVLTSLSIRSLNLSGEEEITRIKTQMMSEKKTNVDEPGYVSSKNYRSRRY